MQLRLGTRRSPSKKTLPFTRRVNIRAKLRPDLLSGRLGEIAGSGLFDMSWLFGKSEADHRQFLKTPRFVARVETLAPAKKK